MNKIVFFYFAAVPVLALGVNLEFMPCIGVPAPIEVSVPECTENPCVIQSGEKVNIDVVVEFDKPMTILPFGISAMNSKGRLYVFHSKNNDACAKLDGGACPLEPGKYTFKSEGTIPKVTTPQKVVFSGMARDADYNPVVCASVVATVVP